MSKFCGFLLSAILVVLCLWLNVFSFPNVVRDHDFPSSASSEVLEAREVSESAKVEETAEVEVSESGVSELKPESRAEELASSTASFRNVSEATTHDADDAQLREAAAVANVNAVVENEETKIASKNNGKAQGGKYVSIPSIEVDAFRVPAGSPHTDRVVRTTRAVVPRID